MSAGFLLPEWETPRGVRVAMTTRAWSGDWQDPAARARLRSVLALPAEPRWLRQVHGTRVLDDGAWSSDSAAPEADAAITREAGAVLVVKTADCLPILLAADDGGVIAAVHAGWRGLAAGVVEATVARMGIAPATISAWLGPAAGPSAYEVDASVRDAFVGPDSGAVAAFRDSRPGHWWCSLPLLARRRLSALGVTRVAGGDRCTITEVDLFHSWRRNADPGRMATLIWRTPTSVP
jgi:YfiH family protein